MTTAAFDPYHRWLGISPKYQPPDHYRLLGVDTLEDDLTVIEQAADRQMAHLRTHQSGAHPNEAAQLLNEVSAARLCLLNVDVKREYDRKFRAAGGSRPSAVRPATSPKKLIRATALPDEPVPVVDVPQAPTVTVTRAKANARRPPRPVWKNPAVIGSAAVGGLVLIVVVLAAVLSQDEQPRTQPTATLREKDKTAEVNPDGKTATERPTRAVTSPASNSPVGNDDPEPHITLGPTVQIGPPNGDPELTAEKQEKLGRSVVAIIASRGTTVERGSGLIVDPKGIIITSSQLVGEASRLRVVFQGGQQAPAQHVMSVHPEWGVAFLQLPRPDPPMPVMS
jgi:hypothetical protein